MRDYNRSHGISRGARAVAAGAMIYLTLLVAGCAHTGNMPAAGHKAPDPGQSTPLKKRKPVKDKHHHDLKTDNLAAKMRKDAPLHYVVKKGDTLWDIAGYYLNDPWYWPQLWDENPDIANPHLIYPGEVLTLSRDINGRPHLHGRRVEHLSPKIREKPLPKAVPTIPYSAIHAFLSEPRLIEKHTLDEAPYIVAFLDEHIVAGDGQTVYVRNATSSGPRRYRIVRPSGVYRDAETGEILGRKGLPVGKLTIRKFGPVSTGVIDHSERAALAGDRLLPISDEVLVQNFHPRAPANPVSAHIISITGGVITAGRYQVVTLDAGSTAGLGRGDVLQIFEANQQVHDPISGGPVTLPKHHVGELMVFKTASKVSFALIMKTSRAIHVSDLVRSPRP